MNADEMLTVLRIKQWRRDRTAAHQGHLTRYRRTGWIERRARDVDTRIVRIIDFERALATLTPHQQTLLIAAYGEGLGHREVARIEGTPDRTFEYQLKGARATLAAELGRRNLL